jgi:hypothetical protein
VLIPLADDLEEEVRALLTQRKITEFITHEQVLYGVMMKLF